MAATETSPTTDDTPEPDPVVIAAARTRAAELVAQGRLSDGAVARINAALRNAAERAVSPVEPEKRPA